MGYQQVALDVKDNGASDALQEYESAVTAKICGDQNTKMSKKQQRELQKSREGMVQLLRDFTEDDTPKINAMEQLLFGGNTTVKKAQKPDVSPGSSPRSK